MASLIKPSHKGRLHRALGVPEDEKIPHSRVVEAEHSKDPHMRAMAHFASNMAHHTSPSMAHCDHAHEGH